MGHGGSPTSLIRNVYPVDDPVLDWRRIPHSHYREGRIAYDYNRLGFRDTDHQIEVSDSKRRLVVLGDSVTEGYGVEWNQVFAAYIQAKLGDRFEVINVAAGGLNTPQEVHLFRQTGLSYQPEIVVLNFVLNDCDFYSTYKKSQRYADTAESKIALLNIPVPGQLKSLLKKSALLFYIKQHLENIMGKLKGVPQTDHYTGLWSLEENRQKVTRGFDDLRALKEEHGFKVVVLVWPLLTEYAHYRFRPVHDWVSAEAKRRGFSSVDLLPHFSNIDYRKLQITAEDCVHPNALGHRIAGDAVVNWFRSSLMTTD